MQESDNNPFQCSNCTSEEKKVRNCFNYKGLESYAIAVEKYTDLINYEHRVKKANKVVSLPGGIRLYECPVSYLTQDTHDIMNIVYLMESTNSLYYDGAIADQPFWLIEAFNIFKKETLKK